MKRTCLALLLLLLALANPCAQPRFDYDSLTHYTADELFRRGNDYLDRNDRDTAMPFFLTIIGNHEHDTDRHTRYLIACSYAAIGDIYYQQGYLLRSVRLLHHRHQTVRAAGLRRPTA